MHKTEYLDNTRKLPDKQTELLANKIRYLCVRKVYMYSSIILQQLQKKFKRSLLKLTFFGLNAWGVCQFCVSMHMAIHQLKWDVAYKNWKWRIDVIVRMHFCWFAMHSFFSHSFGVHEVDEWDQLADTCCIFWFESKLRKYLITLLVSSGVNIISPGWFCTRTGCWESWGQLRENGKWFWV